MGMLSGKGGGKSALAAKPNLLSALRIQTSSYGQVIPILYGQNRIAARLIWAGDFTAIPHTSTTKVGGKGLGSGGGNAISNTTYTYQTAVAMALCMGPIVNIQNVWDTKGRLTLLNTSMQFTVPMGGGGVMIQPPGSGAFHSVRGISRADAYTVDTGPTGDFGSDGHLILSGTQKTPLKQVSSSPGAGQYTQSNSTVTFSSADQNKVMTINYVYSVPDSNSNGAPQQKLSLTLFNGLRPQTPWSYLTSAHPGQDLGYNGIAYAASSAMDLGESGTLPNLSFEVLGVLPFGGNITDAEPSAIIADLLANPFYGLAGVVTPGDLTQYRNFCVANGLFLSPVLDAQKTAAAWIQELLDITNAAAVWSEGVLKIIPYGDTTVVANGATFLPNTQPIYDLTTSDLLSQVVVKRPSVAEVMNAVSVEWTNRANDYNVDVAEDKDDAMIALYGLRKAQPVQAHSITTKEVAKFAANLLRKRSVEIRATYTFNLGWQFNLLEPMDLLTLTVPELGYNKKPVRITAMREDEMGTIQIDAEDFPWGTATPTLYPHQPGSGFITQANADPGPVSTPILFEANDRLSLTGNYEVWIGACGPVHTNLLLKSEQFEDAAWTKANVTSVTADSVADPLGGMTADAVIYSLTDTTANIGQLVTPASSPANKPFTFSCWLKAASGSPTINMLIEDQTFAVIVNQTFTLNQTWQRLSVTGTAGGGATGIRCFLYLPSSTSIAYHYWGAQLEQASTPSGYIKTTTALLTVAVPDWGGCSVWVSPDNITYAQAGKMYGPSRMGALTTFLGGQAADLSSFYNRIGIYTDGSTFSSSGGVDGVGNALSETLVGRLLTFSGASFSFGPPNANDVVAGAGQAVTLPAIQANTVRIIALGVNGNQASQSFQVNYVGGTHDSFTQSLSDWHTPQGYAGERIALAMTYRNLSAGTTQALVFNLYEYEFTVNPANTLASLTLPNNGNVVLLAVTAVTAPSSDPDTTHTLAVDLTQSAGVLNSGTQADCDNFRTLCYVDGELISYEDATLTTAFHYDLGAHGSPVSITGATNASPIQITAANHGFGTGETVVIAGVAGNTAANGTWVITAVDNNIFKLNGSAGSGAYTSGGTAAIPARLRRGVFGSPIGTHITGSSFLRLDDGVFVWEADPSLVGTTIFFKFTSFNRFGLMEQSLASAAAYGFPFTGTFGNIGDPPANNATVDSVFNSGTSDTIRVYGPTGVGTPYTSWKKDQTTRTIPAQTIITVEELPGGPQTTTMYWISYDFNSGTHRAWRNYNNYVQAVGRGQMRVGALTTVNASNAGGSPGGFGDSGDGGSGDPSRPLPRM